MYKIVRLSKISRHFFLKLVAHAWIISIVSNFLHKGKIFTLKKLCIIYL